MQFIKMPLQRVATFSKVFTAQCIRAHPVFSKHVQQLNTTRFLAQKEYPKKVLNKEKEKLRSYAIERYRSYLENYTKVLENRFPAAMKMYKVFSVGIREFYMDLKKYISLRIKISRNGFANMTRQEIELYQKMPSDMLRILPVLVLSAIPFGNYIIFPLAFLKPRKLLCSHFWSIQQRAEFSVLDLQERLLHNRPVFRALQAKLDSIPDGPVKTHWENVIALLGSGAHPSAKDVINCKPLFVNHPYNLTSLSYAHLGHLLQMHGLRRSVLRTKKLKYRALLLLEMDRAVIKEGGVEELNTEALRYACNIRGLNSRHLSNQNMVEWLNKWMEVSKVVDKDSYSLLLHCPIFFGYNHSQNWMLIY